MDVFATILFLVLPALVFLAGFGARNRVARVMLIHGGAFCVAVYIVLLGVSHDCRFSEFRFVDCTLIPERVAGIYSAFHLVYLLFFMVVSPVLLLFAAACETRTRYGSGSR